MEYPPIRVCGRLLQSRNDNEYVRRGSLRPELIQSSTASAYALKPMAALTRCTSVESGAEPCAQLRSSSGDINWWRDTVDNVNVPSRSTCLNWTSPPPKTSRNSLLDGGVCQAFNQYPSLPTTRICRERILRGGEKRHRIGFCARSILAPSFYRHYYANLVLVSRFVARQMAVEKKWPSCLDS